MFTDSIIAGSITDCPVTKISPDDSNKFILLCDMERVPFVSVVEIFDEAGKTPPNIHQEAYEYFYVISGTGQAIVDGQTIALQPGAYLIVPPGKTHEVHNTGSGKLYVLTTMIPDEKFSDLVKSGPSAELDQQDRAALLGTEGS
ncbi:cupin domain-containing protein [Paenibacillaceae bacterium]|nr:cupin domain-containing protein [Paenibacillaceae bacterium]